MLETVKAMDHSDVKELTDLLELAERIQASYETAARRESTLRLLQLIAASLGLASLLLIPSVRNEIIPLIGVVAGVLLGLSAALQITVVQRVRRARRRDRYALIQILDLLRELEHVTAIDDHWTPLQRAEFRIRLSRFEIEEPNSIIESFSMGR
jgi:hypothetical protein